MTILQIYNSYYKHIPLDVFNVAVAADPTSYNQGKIVKVGNFVKWILKLYTNGSWKLGDSYETMDLLSKFIKYKSKLPIEKRDINRYNNIHDLYSLMQTLEGQGVKSQKEVKREGAEVVYEDSEWKIVIPHTKEASCIYGAHTKWCTAGRGGNMFDYYNEKGPLYININKVTGDKYQFHFETGSFMDAEDKKISPKKIGLSEGAVNYYKSIGKEPYFIYDKVEKFCNGFACVNIEGKYNFINTNGELLYKGDKWFDFAYAFSEGFASVYKKGKGWNFIDTNGELVWKEDKWFVDACSFSEGFACVKIEGKGWNFINEQGEFLWKGDNWFYCVDDFHNRFARVKIEGKGWNIINEQGEFLWKDFKQVDYVDNFYNGFARVKLEGKGWNFINTKCELLWSDYKNYDEVDILFFEGFAWVKLEGKYNYINTQGELLWSDYKNYDYVGGFSNGFGLVCKKGKGCNYINKQGELLYKGDKWFDYIWEFRNGFAKVGIIGSKYNFINTQGELVWKGEVWFDDACDFREGFAWVEYKGDWYKLNTKGELIKK